MIFTFYSFKGGVGRSMALANIAELLYHRGLRVLMVDFDLEAPGLERYFDVPEAMHRPKDVLSKRGVIDMLLSYKELRLLPRPSASQASVSGNLESREIFSFPIEPLRNFVLPIYKQNVKGGSLSIIPAGRRAGDEFADYAKRVLSFDWDDFYANWDGERFFDRFRYEVEAIADVILVDSRTGVTEMSGVCTYQLADAVVMFVTTNEQSLSGTLMMARSFSSPKFIKEGRKGRPLYLLFVPSRVDNSEAALLDGFAGRFNHDLGDFITPQLELERSTFIDLTIPYVPYYSYMENVAVRESDRPSAAYLVKSFEKLASTLAQLAPDTHPMYRLYRYGEIPISNPFFYGNPVPPDCFVDRRRELRRIAGRIVNRGQSTAIVGEPRSGKTSLLLYLAAPETRIELYGASGEQLFFSYVDAQTLGVESSQAQFWEYALRPLQERVIAHDPDSLLARAYEVCREDGFGCFTLERFLAQVGAENWRLVLLLDEFDMLLHHPALNSAEFFGGLRSLASRSRALALIIASRCPLTDLNKYTQQFSRASSPYFNFLDEVTLGPLPNKAITELLDRARGRFTPDDCRFIVHAAGGHPCLLQTAASELWEAYVEDQDDPKRRWQQAGHGLYNTAALILEDTWRLWSPAMRKAFTIVALAGVAKLLEQRQFYTVPLVRDKRDVEPELRLLGKQGFVTEDQTAPTGWRVRPQVFLWWLADELVRTVRDETSFEEWLQKQELGFLLTRGEKEQLGKAVRAVADLLKDGAATLIEAAAKGVGEAAMKGG